jgi:hypothetical protein
MVRRMFGVVHRSVAVLSPAPIGIDGSSEAVSDLLHYREEKHRAE